MFKLEAIRLCLLSLLVLTAACNDALPVEEEEPDPEIARVRIVHAAPGLGGVSVQREGVSTPIVPYLNYGGFTQSCLQLPANAAHTLNFRQGGETVAAATFTPATDAKYTVVLTGAGATRRVVVMNDAYTAAAGFNGVRFINVSSGPGDVHVSEADGVPADDTRVQGDIAVTATSEEVPAFAAADTARKLVRLYDVGVTTGTPRADLTLSGLPGSRLASIVLADPAAAGPAASFVTFPC